MGEEDDYDLGEHNKEVYAHFGLAFYQANCFEHGLAIALMYADFLTRTKEKLDQTGTAGFDRPTYEKEFDAFFDNQFSQTLGNLLKRLSASLAIDDALKEKITMAKQRRDFLSHHFFREHSISFMTRSGRDKMIAELEADRELFLSADEKLQKATQPIRQRLGIKDEWLQAQTDKIIAKVERGEPLEG
jgi:hypothetical protein